MRCVCAGRKDNIVVFRFVQNNYGEGLIQRRVLVDTAGVEIVDKPIAQNGRLASALDEMNPLREPLIRTALGSNGGLVPFDAHKEVLEPGRRGRTRSLPPSPRWSKPALQSWSAAFSPLRRTKHAMPRLRSPGRANRLHLIPFPSGVMTVLQVSRSAAYRLRQQPWFPGIVEVPGVGAMIDGRELVTAIESLPREKAARPDEMKVAAGRVGSKASGRVRISRASPPAASPS